ncbi:hypothetical protein [Actinoallomurus sp. NPDC050550]|uniref:hypothetical protein n=1 Tax=Actinoallomurus sp. NPDC050550 TaxID=3154937 RepID=UPI0033EC27DF
MGEEIATETMLRHLRSVRKHAEEAGLLGRVVQTTRSKPPVLVLVNPEARQLSEEISCRELAGVWWLHWSWDDPIARAVDMAGAMAAIRRVLGVRP